MLPKSALATAQLAKTLGEGIALPLLTDLIAYTVEMQPNEKIDFLAETNVVCRAKKLITHLDAMRQAAECQNQHKPQAFPPDFSAN